MAQFRKGRNGWELHWLFGKRRGTDKTKSPERWLDFPGREKEYAMEETTADIKKTTEAINNHLDSLREELKKLQALLDQLGNPGCTFFDNNEDEIHLHSDGYWYCLAYTKGKLRLISHDQKYRREQNQNLELHQIPLEIVVATIERLPIFLRDYKTFLEGKKEDSALTHNQITKMVEAITAILKKK